ncbi:hypothetical protein [Aurantiacibacter suaedae]|uniref:hypothetical protein n=1 Tax=Aurantiacibacter suaedae TaxID=2545755 RepID=UPI0010F8B343|nr:hypothetical protein [Aurantiacibacter suaedae]
MKLTRRSFVAAAAALPAAASAAEKGWKDGHETVLLFDPALAEGRAFADAGSAWNRAVIAIEGDRIRFGRELFARRPAIVQGVSRSADALLLEEVAREAGYERVSLEREGKAMKWVLMPQLRR